MTIMSDPHPGLRACCPHHADLADIDEALRWATAGGVRVPAYIDKLLDARLKAAASA